MKNVSLKIAAILILASIPGLAEDKKLKLEEVLAGHRRSIGAEEFRVARQNLRATGVGTLRILVGPERILTGPAELISEEDRIRSGILFDVSDYPSEEVSFNGEETFVRQLNPGQRSQIGEFLYRYEEILTEGLLGGTLSTAWPLLEVGKDGPKLKYRGLKQFGDTEMHELEYERRTGRKDINVRIYLTKDTFHHIATIYRLVIPPKLPPVTVASTPASRAQLSSSVVGTRVTMEEYFADFKVVDGLVLPSKWKVRLTTEGPDAVFGVSGANDAGVAAATRDLFSLEWDVAFSDISLNTEMSAEDFKLY